MSSSAARAVVAAHGDLASGLVSAVEQITGRADALVALSNRGHSAASLEELLRDTLVALSNRGLSAASLEERLRETLAAEVRVIFTDLPAGSWTMAARRVMRGRDDLLLVTGVNLAVLLDFVLRPDTTHESVEHAVDKGRSAIVLTGAPRGN